MPTVTYSPSFDVVLPKPPIVWWGPDTLAFFDVYNNQQDPRCWARDMDPGPMRWGDEVWTWGFVEPQPLSPCDPPRSPHAFEVLCRG